MFLRISFHALSVRTTKELQLVGDFIPRLSAETFAAGPMEKLPSRDPSISDRPAAYYSSVYAFSRSVFLLDPKDLTLSIHCLLQRFTSTPCLKKNCANLSFALFLSNINRFQ